MEIWIKPLWNLDNGLKCGIQMCPLLRPFKVVSTMIQMKWFLGMWWQWFSAEFKCYSSSLVFSLVLEFVFPFHMLQQSPSSLQNISIKCLTILLFKLHAWCTPGIYAACIFFFFFVFLSLDSPIVGPSLFWPSKIYISLNQYTINIWQYFL